MRSARSCGYTPPIRSRESTSAPRCCRRHSSGHTPRLHGTPTTPALLVQDGRPRDAAGEFARALQLLPADGAATDRARRGLIAAEQAQQPGPAHAQEPRLKAKRRKQKEKSRGAARGAP